MSGLGLGPLGRLQVEDASPVTFSNARRGFGKHSQYGDRYAMILTPVLADAPILVSGVAGTPIRPGGLLLHVSLPDFTRIAKREGYRPDAIVRLVELALESGRTLPDFLWELLSNAAFDIARYRQHLFARLGYTSPHYVPHPISLPNERHGITFLAPGREGSGSPDVVPVRVARGADFVLSLAETWARKANESQLDYFAMCLLGGEHSVSVPDLLADWDAHPGLRQRLETRLAVDRPYERQRFRAALGWSAERYRDRFERSSVIPPE